jgi:AcrR family transcriptional regulator
MGRARGGILDGARATIAHGGVRRMTMSEVAERGGVAKATVYNHFRSRGELLDGLLADELAQLLETADRAGTGTAAQLAALAQSISHNPLLDAIRQSEPEVLAGLTAISNEDTLDRWTAVVDTVRGRLERQGARTDDASVDLVLRWLLSVVLAPAPADRLAAEAGLLAISVTAGPPD